MHLPLNKISSFIALMVLQLILLILFFCFVQYDGDILPIDKDEVLAEQHALQSAYPHFQDIHVMIFVGFGFLMAFLRRYGYSATGFSLFLAAIIVQWAILVKGVLHQVGGVISLSLDSIIDADIAAAVPLISMGALLGRTTVVQLLVMSLVEVVLFTVNEHLQLNVLSVCDVGGSITVHAFGAYFGLALSFILRPSSEQNAPGKFEGASYRSDLFAMIGTLFLWVYWPSFNSVLANGTGQERAILNTYLSLAAATVTTFLVSICMNEERKFDMVHVQNSTLAGGVAIGSVANLIIGPHGAITIGIAAGVISVLGYHYLSPFLRSFLRIHDTCGIHNLHGMPAVLSALASSFHAWFVTKELYKSDMVPIFPAMGEADSVDMDTPNNGTLLTFIGGYNRTASAQAGYQVLSLVLTLAVAIVGGLLTGIGLKYSTLRSLDKEEQHQDEQYWEIPQKDE